jgi:SAM-dependent methyltransferase
MDSRINALVDRALGVARSVGVLGYRPERWSSADWTRAYGSGQLDYFANLDELGRYSMLLGYIGFFGGRPSILDVGCGPGLLRARICDSDFGGYVGIDPNAEAIAMGAHLADERTQLRQCELVDIRDELFDVVVLNEVLYFARSPGDMLADSSRLLRRDGVLLTSMWHHPGDRALWRMIDDRFEPLDSVEIRNRSSRLATRGWRVACHRRVR